MTKEFLKYHDHLGPALFLRMEDGEHGVIPLAYLDSLKTVEKRREYLASLGLSIRLAGDRIREALLVSEVWYVDPEEEDLDIPPSKHPKRKEAIAIMGRDAQGTRYTHVLQPFERDNQNRPVFGTVVEAEYNAPTVEGHRSSSLIDHLFE